MRTQTISKKVQRAPWVKILEIALAVMAIALPLAITPTAQAAEGDLFVTDLSTGSIVVYSTDGSKRTFATGLDRPQGLAFDPKGNLYVADKGSGKVFKFAADATRTLFASGLDGPAGLVYSNLTSSIYVSEEGGDRVSQLDRDGSVIDSIPIASPIGIAIRDLTKDTSADSVNTTWIVSNPDASGLVQEDIESGVTNTFLMGLDPQDIVFAPGPVSNAYATAYVSTKSDNGSVHSVATQKDSSGNLQNVVTEFVQGLGDIRGLAFRRTEFTPPDQPGDLFAADTSNGNIWRVTPPPTMTQTLFASGGQPNFLAFQTILAGKVENISTRGQVLTGDNVLIVGFIVTGDPGIEKTVILRGIGPSLADGKPPVAGALADPVLKLYYPDGTTVKNDDWMNNSQQDIDTLTAAADGSLVPTNDKESVIVAKLNPGAYTAILSGKDGGTGIGMVEAYDIDPSVAGELGNISTRGYVDGGDNVLIGGFIIGPKEAGRIVIRAIGPELADRNVPTPLADPMLELFDRNGNILSSNDDWADTAKGEISATGLAPTNPKESAILANLPVGQYTAIVSGKEGKTGVALVEAYHIP